MTTQQDWLEYLNTEGAVIEGGKVSCFAMHEETEPDLQQSTIMAPLDDHALIRVSGEDSMDFLQNQLSNDIRLISDTRSQLAAYCSPKGRVLSLLRIIKQGDVYFLILPRERLQPTLNRLRMFVLRSKVTLEDATGQTGVLGIAGRNAQAAVNTLECAAPEEADSCSYTERLAVIKVAEAPDHYLIFADYEELKHIWQKCKEIATPVTAQNWAYWEIQAGIPQVLEANSDEFVPQMLNLHSLNAVNFQKGCYPGQEVVARMHYLGKQKRRMYLAHIDTATAVQPGDSVYGEPDAGGQSVGKVVNVSASPHGGFDALVVMQIASVENRDPVLTRENAALNFKDLPYFVEVEGKK